MAHPLRIRLLEGLGRGPATASQLARALGESSGATSYHLRVLARAGLIEEDSQQPSGRERWWREAPVTVGVRRGSDDPVERAVEIEMRAVDVENDAEVLARLLGEEDRLDDAWRKAVFIHGWTVKLTAAEAVALGQEMRSLVMPFLSRKAPVGAIEAQVSFRIVPWVRD
jgi:DNA-binding transcriptional ArsR family regulator